MSNFDFADYIPGAKPSENKSETKASDYGKFSFSDYTSSPPEKEERPGFFSWPGQLVSEGMVKRAYGEDYVSPLPEEEREKLGIIDRTIYDFKRDFQQHNVRTNQAGKNKSFLKGLTLGKSSQFDYYKHGPEEDEEWLFETAGEGALILLGQKVFFPSSYAAPAVASNPLTKPTVTEKAVKLAKEVAPSVGIGTAFESQKQLNRGEPQNIPKQVLKGIEYGLFHLALLGAKGAYNFFKNLKPKQQAQALVEGVIPDDLNPTSYKTYQNEVVPELQRIGRQELDAAHTKAVEANDLKYEQKLANTQAQHEADLLEIAQKQEATEQDIFAYEENYQNKLRQIQAEHEADLQRIEAENARSQAEFDAKEQEFAKTKATQDTVEQAINNIPTEESPSLEGRVSEGGEPLQVKPEFPEKPSSTKQRVGSVISPDKIENRYVAGSKNKAAVQATADAEYKAVQKLYDENIKINETIETTHPTLANELRSIIKEIDSIPEPSAPQKQIKNAAEKILNEIVSFDESGNITGYKPVNNNVLLNQAKSLRQSIDYDFAQANPRGVFMPTIESLENAALRAAAEKGNDAAVKANKAAKEAYKKWAETYQNDFIRTLRDTSNHKFSQSFDSSLNVDNFKALDNVLQKSNAGQQLASQTRRELITDQLSPFIKNPKKINPEALDEALNELSVVLRPGEEYAIRQSLAESRRAPVIIGTKVPTPKAPEAPKTKTIESVNIPLFKPPTKEIKFPSKVKIPLKGEVKPTKAMKEASDWMKITPEKVKDLTNTPTGIKKLKAQLSKSPEGKKLFEKVGHEKIKEILHGGKVKRVFTGKELEEFINKTDNYDILSEIMGEDTVKGLLDAAIQIKDKRMTVDLIKNLAIKASWLKTAVLFGIF